MLSLQDEFPFWGSTALKPETGSWLAQPFLSLSLLQPLGREELVESGPGAGCGWLSKLGNVLVITFYCCLHFNFQPVFLHPASYLTRTANLILASFLQKHLTLCKNLASLSLLLPQTSIISISRQHCQTAACVGWALWCHRSPPLPGKRAVATSCHCPGDLVQHFTSRQCHCGCELSQLAHLIKKSMGGGNVEEPKPT